MMASLAATPSRPSLLGNLRTAFTAVRRLMADGNDTVQVFRIVRALNGDTARKGYERLLRTAEGGRIAYERVELARLFSDPAYVAAFPAGSVGGAYAAFLAETGYSAAGLETVSRADDDSRQAPHPYAWFARRNRDLHDVWHVLTGYQADDPLGELCLVAFTYGQNGGLGFATIATVGALRGIGSKGGRAAIRAIWEGYRHGGKAAWLVGEDIERLFAEPLEDARARLGIAPPDAYRRLRG